MLAWRVNGSLHQLSYPRGPPCCSCRSNVERTQGMSSAVTLPGLHGVQSCDLGRVLSVNLSSSSISKNNNKNIKPLALITGCMLGLRNLIHGKYWWAECLAHSKISEKVTCPHQYHYSALIKRALSMPCGPRARTPLLSRPQASWVPLLSFNLTHHTLPVLNANITPLRR